MRGIHRGPGTGEFPPQMAINAKNVSIWWRHHAPTKYVLCKIIGDQMVYITGFFLYHMQDTYMYICYWVAHFFIANIRCVLTLKESCILFHTQAHTQNLTKPLHNALHWRHNEGDGVSNHRRLHWLLSCWFMCRSKKTSKLCVTGLCVGNSPVNSSHKRPVTRKLFPFNDVIMECKNSFSSS